MSRRRTAAVPETPLRKRCKASVAAHRKRARQDRQTLDYGVEDLEARAKCQRNCAYCGAYLTVATISWDHRTPTCRQADYSLGNLALCCEQCNRAKGLLTAEEYCALLGLIRTWHPRAQGDVLGRLRSGAGRYARRRHSSGGRT